MYVSVWMVVVVDELLLFEVPTLATRTCIVLALNQFT